MGSSPLARGLQVDPLTGYLSGRIIPARAGFTVRRRSAPPEHWDHPRSRGVYSSLLARSSPASGSSPLARGLRRPSRFTSSADRIIPARAGFTWPSGTGVPRLRDHPRSRGVYLFGFGFGVSSDGSSPLARGLHLRARRARGRCRIIPARAGFTGDFHGRVLSVRDHPRSRGVYAGLPGCRATECGSSPLARGLLRPRVGPIVRRWDHPRSRGVYKPRSFSAVTVSGSSPLARGLPSAAKRWMTCPGDHPRSRGVY